jgi:transposase InsO family protein
VLPALIAFHAIVHTQFQRPLMCLQTDNGKEFDNHAARSFFLLHDIVMRLMCPYTSQQNGRAECTLRTLNDSMHTMLLHAAVPPSFWPNALATMTYLLNHRPYRVRQHLTPYELLLGHAPDYNHLRVFGSLCYPSIAATSPHKLAPLPPPQVPRACSMATQLKQRATVATTLTLVV